MMKKRNVHFQVVSTQVILSINQVEYKSTLDVIVECKSTLDVFIMYHIFQIISTS